MKKNDFRKQYKELDAKVIAFLKELIIKSNYQSKHIQEKAIKIKLDTLDYSELAIINDKLTFLDKDGYQYHNFHTQDLIDILESLEA